MRKLPAALLALLIAGCGGNKPAPHVVTGDDLLSRGNYCGAYLNFRKEETHNPDLSRDERFTTNLFIAKKECVAVSFKKGSDLAAKGEYDEAIAEFKRALALDKDHKKSHQALERALNLRAEQFNRSDDILKEAQSFSEQRKWRKAADRFESALKKNPGNELAQQGLEECRTHIRRSDEIMDSACKLETEKKWREAIAELAQGADADPENADLKIKLAAFRKELERARELCQRGTAELGKQRRKEGVRLLAEALAVDPGLAAAREALVAFYLRTAGDLEEQGKLGSAICCYKKVLALDPGKEAPQKRVPSLEEEIRERTRVKVAILPLKEYTRDPDLSERLYGALARKLGESDLRSLKVVENGGISALLEEKKVPIDRVTEGKDLAVLKGVKGAQALVAAKVSSFKIVNDRKAESRSKPYQSGTNRVHNPAYDEALEKLRVAETAAEAARKAANQLGAWGGIIAKGVTGGSVVALRNALKNTPEEIDEPVMDTWHYRVIHHTKRGVLGIAYRLVDTENAATVVEESVTAEAASAGQTVENANPRIGVHDKSSPPESDEEVKNAAIAKGVDLLADRIAGSLKRYALRWFTAAERHAATGNRLAAIESYSDFLYAVPEGSDGIAPQVKRSKEFLEQVELD